MITETVKAFIQGCSDEFTKNIKEGLSPNEAFGKAVMSLYAKNILKDPKELLDAIEICAYTVGVKDLHDVNNADFQNALSMIESDIAEQTDEARRERLAAATDRQMRKAQDIIKILQEQHAVDPADIDSERAKILDGIENAYNQLGELLTSADIDDDADFEPSITDIIATAAEQTDGFEPATLKTAYISFPDASISFMGAPTSRGKTAMMISIALDALKDTKRKVIFMSLEETAEQILRRLVFALAYRTADEAKRQKLVNGVTKPRKAWKAFAKMIQNPKDDSAQLQGAGLYSILKDALDEVTSWQNNKRLAICDCEGRRKGKIFARIAGAAQGDIVFYDYIQRLPCGIQSLNTDMRFAVQGINDDLLRIVKRRKAIVIAGAQFNRTGGKATSKQKEAWQKVGDDNLDDTLFAECGGIEKDAHIAIGIGGNANDNTRHFLKVLKNREGEKNAMYNLDFCGAFSYVKATTRLDTSTQAGNGKDTTTEQTEGGEVTELTREEQADAIRARLGMKAKNKGGK